MTRRVWREGNAYRKSVADAEAARLIARRTEALRAAGVPTPAATLDAGSATLSFPAVEGQSGISRIVAQGKDCLPVLLRPLLVLHRAEVAGLAPFDPLAKILPRLGPGDPHPQAQSLAQRIGEAASASRNGPVHGDFHAGQLVVDAGGAAWLLDLEDLALGPPEADLGNFAAHLATRPETRRNDAAAGFASWLVDVLGAYAPFSASMRAVARFGPSARISATGAR